MATVNEKMTTLANEVRELSGSTELLSIDEMTTNVSDVNDEVNSQTDLIAQIKDVVDTLPEAGDGGEMTLQSKTVTPTTSLQIVSADSGYDGLDTVTVNPMPTATQATPSISVSSSGLITSSTTQSAGYVVSGTKSATKQLTTQAAKTYTPTISDQTIASGTYLTDVQTIKGDANLIPANIVSGVSIFGVAGNAASGGGSGDFETATVSVTSYRSDHYICYTGVNEVITQSNFSSLTFTCIKPSVVYLETRGAKINTSTNIERPSSTSGYLFIIQGDGTITFTLPGGGADD